jgi:hypothetical protein
LISSKLTKRSTKKTISVHPTARTYFCRPTNTAIAAVVKIPAAVVKPATLACASPFEKDHPGTEKTHSCNDRTKKIGDIKSNMRAQGRKGLRHKLSDHNKKYTGDADQNVCTNPCRFYRNFPVPSRAHQQARK